MGNSVMAVIVNGYIEPTEGLWVSPCGSFGGGFTMRLEWLKIVSVYLEMGYIPH